MSNFASMHLKFHKKAGFFTFFFSWKTQLRKLRNVYKHNCMGNYFNLVKKIYIYTLEFDYKYFISLKWELQTNLLFKKNLQNNFQVVSL